MSVLFDILSYKPIDIVEDDVLINEGVVYYTGEYMKAADDETTREVDGQGSED